MARSDILTEIQKAPDILEANGDWVGALLDSSIDFVASYCHLSRFPFLNQGTSVGLAGASTDLSSLTNNEIWVSVDFSDFVELEVTLASMASGAAAAAELQTQIRAALDDGDAGYDVFQLVTVTFGSTQYTATSPTYGVKSSIRFEYAADELDVARSMGLGPDWGGIELSGSARDTSLERAVANIVVGEYRKTRLMPEVYQERPSFTTERAFAVLDRSTISLLQSRRKLNV